MNEIEADKLRTYLRAWRVRNPYRWQDGPRAVAEDLMRDVAFADIKIAQLLETNAGATIMQVVESTLPFPGSPEVVVMVEAIEIASKQRTATQALRALGVGVAVVLVLSLVFSYKK